MNIDAYCVIGKDREFDLTPKGLIAEMDRVRVDKAIIAPVDRYFAVNNREGNEYLAKTYSKYKSRFIPACIANPWLGKKAVDEVVRAVANGARILILNPFIQGFQANDELAYPLLGCASKLRIPVYIHTGMPGNSTPWQLVNVAEKFPETDFIMGHCGATDFWNDVAGAVKSAKNIFIESSLARPFVFCGHLKSTGKEKGIMGSLAPLNRLTFEWAQMRRLLPENENSGVYGGNIRKLLEKRSIL